MNLEEISAIGIALTRVDQVLLFLEVLEDDSVRRLGDGTLDGPADLATGQGPPGLFLGVRDALSPELRNRSGSFALPGRRGDSMTLTIRLTGAGADQVLELQYGADSATPPLDVQQFVSAAVAMTDDWYEELLDLPA